MDTERLSVDLIWRDNGGRWVLYPSETGDALEFASLGLSVSMERLCEDVSMGTVAPQPGV